MIINIANMSNFMIKFVNFIFVDNAILLIDAFYLFNATLSVH